MQKLENALGIFSDQRSLALSEDTDLVIGQLLYFRMRLIRTIATKTAVLPSLTRENQRC